MNGATPVEPELLIWLTPDEESLITYHALAVHLGIPKQTLKQRLANYGPDHNLTYFPGKIPAKIRRMGKRKSGASQSTLGFFKIDRLESLDGRLAAEFVVKLIQASQRDLIKHHCQDSFDFLTNKNGMLEWYLECIPRVDCDRLLEDLREWSEALMNQRVS